MLMRDDQSGEKRRDALFRCFEREVRDAAALLAKIRSDLDALVQVCEGAIKQTNYLRSLMTDLSKVCSLIISLAIVAVTSARGVSFFLIDPQGVIPKEWQRYHLPEGTSLQFFFVDLLQR
jgi:hypothetical protein